MLDAAQRTSALEYYAKIGASLFPIPAGKKEPFGIVSSFKHDHSSSPEQWKKWELENPECNFGIVAFASNLIICDIDTSGGEKGRAEAWNLWADLCRSWGLSEPLAPHCQSPSGGWHCYLAVPPHIDAASLRQPDAIKKRINVRCVGYTVAAGSTFKNKPYLLFPNVSAPHQAPNALIAHCTRGAPRSLSANTGSRDKGDVAALLTWMFEHGAFESYEDWCAAGMALRIEYGDDGEELWALCHDGTVTPEIAETKWQSFATEPTADSVTLASLLQRAHAMGWRGSIRKSTSAMFSEVAQLAAASGASLPSGSSGLTGNTQRIIGLLGQPILDAFLEATTNAPCSSSCPTLSEHYMREHPLFEMMNTAISRIAGMAETSKSFRQQRVWSVLKVLRWMHEPTYLALIDSIAAHGAILTPHKLEEHNKDFEVAISAQTKRELTGQRGFINDGKGKPDPQISDNVATFLGMARVQLRFDDFTRRVEVAENGNDKFVRCEQPILNKLLYKAKSADFNFHPSKDFFRMAIEVEARGQEYDSLLDKVDSLEPKWDRVPRLDSWLTRACGVENDLLHQTIGRNLIGGMVRRARYPGCVQAETVIFISPLQGTGKSSLCRILALDSDRYLGSYKLGGSQQNSLPLLSGKWVVELSELAGLNTAAIEDVKTLLTETCDEYVAKYEAIPTVHPRRCVFIGTSNLRQPLSDPSGNRRFLPVHVVGEIDLEWLQTNAEQLIGEAAARETAGESFAITKDVWSLTSAAQEAARQLGPVEEACQEWFLGREDCYVLPSDVRRALEMSRLRAGSRYSTHMESMGWNQIQANTRGRDRVWMSKGGKPLGERSCLVPWQGQTLGRVEMRVQAGSLK